MIDWTGIIEEGRSLAAFTESRGAQVIDVRLDGTLTLPFFATQGAPLSPITRATFTGMLLRMAGVPNGEEQVQRRSALLARVVARLCQEHAQELLQNWPEEKRDAIIRHALALANWARARQASDTEAFVDFRDWQTQHPAEAASLLAGFPESAVQEFEATQTRKVHELVFAYLQPEEELTLSAFQEYLSLADEDAEECRWLATLLEPWCRDGNYGVLFDGVPNVSLNTPVLHLELGFIPEAAKEVKGVIGFGGLHVVRQRCLTLPRQLRKRIVIEEVSRFLQIPGGEAILRELFEQFRKFNVQVIIVAQQFSRLADTPIRAAIMGNTRGWLIFNTGDKRDVERLSQDLGLSQTAQETILRFTRPDQQTGAKFSEALYWHSDVRQPVCGSLRYFLLPHKPETRPPTANVH
jgi:hypothetical protein